MITLLVSLAAAAPLDPGSIDPARYPWRAELSCSACPAEGPDLLRIPIPVALRSAADPVDGSDLAVLDATGRPLAVAVARGPGQEEEEYVRVTPTATPGRWLLDVGARPVEGLVVEHWEDEWVATARVLRVEGSGLVPVGEPTLVWSTASSRQHRVALAPVTGELILELEHHLPGPFRAPRVAAVLRPGPHVDDLTWTVPLAASRLREEGVLQAVAVLSHPLPVARARLLVDDPVFERRATARLQDEELLEAPGPWDLDQVVRRVRLGGASLDEVALDVRGGPADTLVVAIDSEGSLPLSLTGLALSMPGEELLVPAPGPGPWTLLAGAEPGTTPVSDVHVALPELARAPSATATVGPRADNPAWTPPEERAGLAAPSTPIDLRGLRWAHPVQGEGLVRVPLTAEVLADARADLGDLRLVADDGRQVPYLLRGRPLDAAVALGTPTRTEDGRLSRLRVPVPGAGDHDDGPPLSSVCLDTEAPVFSRTVTLARARGAELEPLRVFRWSGDDRPVRLCLALDAPVGRELVVEVDNGDDPPLPLGEVTATTPAWELVAVLPSEPVRLVYGDPERPTPDYDLALLRASLAERATAEATLGPRVAMEPPAASPAERAMVLAGLAVLALGLGGLVLGVVRAVPAGAEREEEAPGTG